MSLNYKGVILDCIRWGNCLEIVIVTSTLVLSRP